MSQKFLDLGAEVYVEAEKVKESNRGCCERRHHEAPAVGGWASESASSIVIPAPPGIY